MKVLITGAAGYLGSQLTMHLINKGIEVIAYDNMMYNRESLLLCFNHPNLNIVQADVRDLSIAKKHLQNCDYLIYLAGIVGDSACKTAPAISKEVNTTAIIDFLKISDKSEIKNSIFISTCSNYGISNPNELVNEQTKLNPLSEYSNYKIEIENYLINQYNAPYTILRLGTLCGISSRMRFDLLINEMCKLASLGRDIHIYTPQAWRPYLTLEEASQSIEKVLLSETKFTNNEIYNIVSENLQKSDLINLIRHVCPDASIKITDKAPDLRDYRVDGNKFNKIFGNFKSNSIKIEIEKMCYAIKNNFFEDIDSNKHSAIPLGSSST